jgi:hypothetical protein
VDFAGSDAVLAESEYTAYPDLRMFPVSSCVTALDSSAVVIALIADTCGCHCAHRGTNPRAHNGRGGGCS